MPNKMRVSYTYICGICGQEYSHEQKKRASILAERCKCQGTPFIHRFQPGTQLLSAMTKDPNGTLMYESKCASIKILGRSFEPKTHRPMYHIRFASGIEHRSFPAENIFFRTIIYRFTSGATPASGEVLVEERVVESTEPRL